MFAGIEEIPELRPLESWIPLSELVAVGVDAFLGARFLFIATGPAEDGVEPQLGDRVEQRDGLQAIAAGGWPFFIADPAEVDRILHPPDFKGTGETRRERVTERERFGEVMAGVDVQQRNRQPARVAGL